MSRADYDRLDRRLNRMERILEQLAQHAGVDLSELEDGVHVSAEVRRLADQGRTIEAIKQLRVENRFLGLKEAKDIVDGL